MESPHASDDQLRALLSPQVYDQLKSGVLVPLSHRSSLVSDTKRRSYTGQQVSKIYGGSHSQRGRPRGKYKRTLMLTTPPLTDPEALHNDIRHKQSQLLVSPWLLPEAGNRLVEPAAIGQGVANGTPAPLFQPPQAEISPLTPSFLMNLNPLAPSPEESSSACESEAKRKYHNLAEQRRRDTVKESLAQLRDLLPADFLKEREKASKMVILQQTVDYIKYLHKFLPLTASVEKPQQPIREQTASQDGVPLTLNPMALELSALDGNSNGVEGFLCGSEMLQKVELANLIGNPTTDNQASKDSIPGAKVSQIRRSLLQDLSILTNPLFNDAASSFDDCFN